MPEGHPTESFEQAPKITQKKESGFPKDVGGRMDAILGSFNIPTRASIMLIAGSKGDSNVDLDSLIKSLRDLLSGSEMDHIKRSTVLEHCRNLCKAGFLKKEFALGSSGEETSFHVTEAGRKYGMPTAAYMLLYQLDHGFSLYPIFSRSQQSRHEEYRVPWTRARILKSLEEGPKRETDIFVEIKLPLKTIGPSLPVLAEAGVIEYSAVTPQTYKTQVEYKLLEDHVPLSDLKSTKQTIFRSEIILKETARISLSLKDKNIPITAANILQHFPEEVKARWTNSKTLQHEISRALSDLTRQNFLKRGMFRGGETQSNAALTEKGIIVLDLIHALENSCKDGPELLELQNVVLPQVMKTLGFLTRETADLYYPYSYGFQFREGGSERRAQLLQALAKADSQKGITIQDIAKKVGAKVKTINADLRLLLKTGEVARVNRNSVYYYYQNKSEAA